MKYLLDTCGVSDFIKGDKNTLIRIKHSKPGDLAISSITAMELEFGLLNNPQRAKKIKRVLNQFISCINVLDYTHEDAEYSATFRAQLKKSGTPIGSYDLLIAGTAANNDLILVTSNEKEFHRIKALKIENWRHPIKVSEPA